MSINRRNGAGDKSLASHDLIENADGRSEEDTRRAIARFFEIGMLFLVAHFTWVATHSPIAIETKVQALSAVGLFIDPASLISARLLIALKILMFALLALWLSKRANRVVYALAPFVFILMMSSVVETHYFVKHQTNFCAMAFVVLAAARFFGSKKGQNFDSVDPLPSWAFMTLVFYIGVSYTFSGIEKLYCSGLQWGDGRALMLWVDVHAAHCDNILFDAIVGSHLFASILQMTTLVAETAGLMMLFVPRLRVILGVILVGFHVSIELLFGFGFYANIFLDAHILILCYFAPQYRILGSDFLRDLFARKPSGVFAADTSLSYR